MGRITRAKAAEVAEKLHIDEDAVLDMNSDAREVAEGMLTPEPRMNRTPLAEIAPNSGGSSEDTGEDFSLSVRSMPGKKQKGRNSGKKGVVSATVEALEAKAMPEVAIMSEQQRDSSILSPARSSEDTSAEDLMKEVVSPEHNSRAGASSFESQDANAAPASNVEMSHGLHQDMNTTAASDENDLKPVDLEKSIETSVSDSPDTMPNTVQRSKSPNAAAASNPEEKSSLLADMKGSQYDALEAAAIQAATPPRSASKSASPPDDAIDALDDLDDAVEKINEQVPEVQPSPMKVKSKKEKAAPTVRTTKASQARMSIAHGPKEAARAPALGRPRQSMSAEDGKRVTSTSSVKSNGKTEDTEPAMRKEVVIPHSKPRPVSMSFPAPRLPSKSTKAPTQANFTLPGEAMSAKFKAAREARALREAEESKRRVFKARPAPSMVKRDPPVVRQTSTSKARESMIGGANSFVPSTTHNRANSVATSRPATSVRKPSGSRPPTTTLKSSVTKSTAPSSTTVKKSTVPAKAVTIPKRASTAMGALNKPTSNGGTAGSRPSTAVGRVPSAGGGGGGTAKGKEVFNRVAQAKGEAEREKKAKEEAARAARVAAAERSRALSREWAEKRKGKKVVAA